MPGPFTHISTRRVTDLLRGNLPDRIAPDSGLGEDQALDPASWGDW